MREAIAENWSVQLEKWNQLKKRNGYKIRTKIVRDYRGMRLMLHTRSIYYCHTNFDLLGVCPLTSTIQILAS